LTGRTPLEHTLSQFIDELRNERERLEPDLEPAELPAALDREAAAKNAFNESRDKPTARYGGSTSDWEAIRRETQEATQSVEVIKDRQASATSRVQEIDRLLRANENKPETLAAASRINAALRADQTLIAQLGKIEADLQAEIEDATRRREEFIRNSAAAAVEARLAGKGLPPTLPTAINGELESCRSTLEATRTAKAAAAARVRENQDHRDKVANRYRGACGSLAEIEFYETLGVLMPIIGRLVANGRSIWRDHARPGIFPIAIDAKIVALAAKLVADELAAA
jgi:chromosome segregation ATPase